MGNSIFIDIAQTEDQVCLALLQVAKNLLMVLQADDVGNVELLHQQLEQVDAIALGFIIVIQVGIWPDALGVLKDQRSLRRIYQSAVRLSGNVSG